MNPGAFSNSGPLSWAMYLMRKGRTGGGLFGNSTSPSTIILSCLLSAVVELVCCVVACRFTSCFLRTVPKRPGATTGRFQHT